MECWKLEDGADVRGSCANVLDLNCLAFPNYVRTVRTNGAQLAVQLRTMASASQVLCPLSSRPGF